jgi:prohibitin 2
VHASGLPQLPKKKQARLGAHTPAVSPLPTTQAIAENPGFLQLRRIDAAREIATTLSQSANRVFLDSNQLLLNVDSFHYDEYVAGWHNGGTGC